MNFSRPNCLAAALVLVLLIIGGCAEREPAKPTPQMDAPERFWIRVLLADHLASCMFSAGSPVRVIRPQGETTEVRLQEMGEPTNIDVSGGRISIGGHVVNNDEAIVAPDEPYIFNFDGSVYRGKIKFILNADGNSFDAVNLVPLEAYLAGVVGAEMPNYWEPAALEAQAIAARTYCLYIKRHFGNRRSWDVCRSQANQVYLGVAAESAQVWGAVNMTSGQVLVCKQADAGERIFPAYYSSTCGGYTENSRNVFGDSFEPLAGVRCPYCKDVARPGFFFWPMAQFDKGHVSENLRQRYPKLQQLGEIANIIAAAQSNYDDFSRLTSVKLLGSTGTAEFLRAEDLRLTVDPTGQKIRSTICQIVNMGDKWGFLSGRGYGHGVGMCQCGAQAMAREGKTARQILYYYYPNSRIVSVYKIDEF
ncbi:MAG TPA: SpoIID/LytB domain-containing protein [Sedimentisphaerales bacterium]|nr:SpoIID/LytB domain-containing protein [Sedimentisphaerales bacterium]